MKNIIISFTILLGFGLSAFAQEKSNKEVKGDKFFFTYSYDKAIDKYKHAKQLTVPGQRRLAESYFIMGQNAQAEETYLKLVNASNGVIAEDYFNYAMVLKNSGKYEESTIWLDKFQTMAPTDLRAISYSNNKAKFPDYLTNDSTCKIIKQSINTEAQDFGTSYYDDKIVYASSNAKPKMIKRRYNWNGQPFLNLYIADVENGQLKNPAFFNKDLNDKMHEGPASFSNGGTKMAFTRNNEKDKSKDKIVELQIFLSEFKDGKWSDAIPFVYNNTAYSVGHPFLTLDGKTMYFASDMPGGFGGTDLYKSILSENGEWLTPVNLGIMINTEGDEMFPFFEEEKQTLSFASNGHFGLGGLDIFNCALNGADWGLTVNPGAPINTQYDDYAQIFNNKSSKGYISSNRTDGSGNDDIYAFEIAPKVIVNKIIVGIAKDTQGKAIPGTFVSLLDEQDTLLAYVLADDLGAYQFSVVTDKNFELTGTKEYYLDGSIVTSSYGVEDTIVANLTLLQDEVEEEVVIVPEDLVVDKDLAKLVKLKPIYFDFDKFNIRPDAAKELDKIVKIMNVYSTMKVELGSHTDCRGTTEYNMVLSENRAKSSVEYIQSRITNPERIYGKGYGENKLINDCKCEDDVVSNCSIQEHQDNRRTEFIIKK